MACRIARNEQGNTYVIYGEEETKEKDNYSIATQIDNVFIKDRIKPFFQHIIKVSNAESLSRKENLYTTRVNLIGRDNSVVTADQFMPILEKTNKSNTLDRWVIKFCIKKLIEEYSKNSIDTGLFMTLSSSSFSDQNLYKWFEKLIDSTDFPDIGYSLVVEIDTKKFLTYQNETEYLRAPLKMHFFRDCGVGSVLKSSCIPYTLRFCARCLLALTKKSLFLEVPLIENLREKYGISSALLHVPNHTILEQCMKHVHFEYTRFAPYFGDTKMNTNEIKKIVSIAHEHDSLVIADKLETGESLASAIDAGVDYVSGYIIQPPQEKLETEESMEI